METKPQGDNPSQEDLANKSSGISRRKFIKRTTGTVLVFGLAASTLYAAPQCTLTMVSCSPGGPSCDFWTCPPGSNPCEVPRPLDPSIKDKVPADGKKYQYGCGKWAIPV
jgi:hypothetical protein